MDTKLQYIYIGFTVYIQEKPQCTVIFTKLTGDEIFKFAKLNGH